MHPSLSIALHKTRTKWLERELFKDEANLWNTPEPELPKYTKVKLSMGKVMIEAFAREVHAVFNI